MLPLLLVLGGCHEEPPIVIKFEPADLTASGTPKAAPHDLAPPAAPPDLSPPKAAKAEPPKPAKAECKTKADCVVEPADCCDCANGGKQHAIAKLAAKASKAERDKRCKGTFCTQVFSTDPTCGKAADCKEGQCVLVEKKP
jgi:hypothetical protein